MVDRRNRRFGEPVGPDLQPHLRLELSHNDDEWTGKLEQIPVERWEEVKRGMMVYLKYWLFWHAVLVTKTEPSKNELSGIHYAVGRWGLLSSRVVKEDVFTVNLKNNELWEVKIPENARRSADQAVAMGRELIDEKKFNMFTRRSRHMVLECILKNK